MVVLNHLDEIERVKGDTRALKNSLIASGADYKVLFPEYAPAPEEPKEEEEGEHRESTADWDYSNVEWKSPTDDPDFFKNVMDRLAGSQSMSGDDVADVEQYVEPTWTDWQ